MKVLPAHSSLNFASKSKAAQEVLKQFDRDVLTHKTWSAPVETQRLVLEKLLQGFEVPFLVKALNISKHKIYNLSTKYNAHKVYIQDKNNIILQRLMSGQKRSKIAKEMNIDVTSVNTIAEMHNTYTVYKAFRDNLIKEKYLSGMKRVDIARELKINPETVSRALIKMGLKT